MKAYELTFLTLDFPDLHFFMAVCQDKRDKVRI